MGLTASQGINKYKYTGVCGRGGIGTIMQILHFIYHQKGSSTQTHKLYKQPHKHMVHNRQNTKTCTNTRCTHNTDIEIKGPIGVHDLEYLRGLNVF